MGRWLESGRRGGAVPRHVGADRRPSRVRGNPPLVPHERADPGTSVPLRADHALAGAIAPNARMLLPGLPGLAAPSVPGRAAAARRDRLRLGPPRELLRLPRAGLPLESGDSVHLGSGRRHAELSVAI